MDQIKITNAIVTYLLGLVVAVTVSGGAFLTTAIKYPFDFIFMGLGGFLAFAVSHFSVKYMQRGFWKESVLMYLLYYYGSFGLFSDGHAAGWTHSEGILEKLVMSQMYILISVFSLFIPLLFIALTITHTFLLYSEVKKAQT
ncbi:hypothetical protein [Vibrio navarrensis]|uniref:hypothetical protein n=1 Tax=Vibrio navarrensis TaxID=29495 RepID=UPI0018DC1754|nr:hypothetical protein [Vibrio navarrensis]MBH9742351.1 hypothetical protein [Vibrio navarrensis]